MLRPMKPIEERVRRRAVAVAMTAAVTAAGVLGVAGPARAAVTCNPNWTMVNGQGAVTAAVDYNVKNGPYGACGQVGRITKGTTFYLWCMTTNDYGNNWWYGRIAGTDIKGWVHQDTIGNGVFRIRDDSPDDGKLVLEGCGPKVVWP
ncbi:hypothetical protein Aca07nite_37560 [Actinoplanes capillaceus]|uniref:SH3 domain-containing protein n=2 Tax=Actinoplanes campanulatus TaxID=113559 RepID=A0ABQ3WJS1_9ACTN|nr:hypothetical protein Aca07nite_37560 [Actinoplanes capillaceus]